MVKNNIFQILSSVFRDLGCIWTQLITEGFKCYISRNLINDKKLLILVNGPSLDKNLDHIIENRIYEKCDLVSVNFLTSDSRFFILKPAFHVISDINLFFYRTQNKERVDAFFYALNTKVDWDMKIFAPIRFCKDKEWIKNFKNPHITLVPIHARVAPVNKIIVKFLGVRGLLAPDWGTVLHHAIYVGMIMGYKNIELYGADHTFFDGLMVDDQNRVCRSTTHFDDKNALVKPLYYVSGGKEVPFTMYSFLLTHERIFHGHDYLRMLADNMSVKILNKTKGSMIDSYEK